MDSEWVFANRNEHRLGPGHNSKFQNEQCSGAVVDIETLLVEQFNADLPECSCSDKAEMSQEDLKFMQCVEQSIQYKDGHYCIE